MPRHSAGILFHRTASTGCEVLLVHPGGPLWRRKDIGAWQLPKGEIEPGEDAEAAARREVAEELGVAVIAPLTPLGDIRQKGGKIVTAFAAAQDIDAAAVVSTTVSIEWPPRSGRRLEVPEIDAARWLGMDDARRLILPSQAPLLDRLAALVIGLDLSQR